MSLAYYTMDDLRLGRGGFLQKGWTIRQRPELGEALAHYRGMPITKRKVLGLTDGFHVLELVKNVPLFPDDPEGEDVLASELGEPLPQWADTPEACQAFRACVEELGLRYQIEGKILAPIPRSSAARSWRGNTSGPTSPAIRPPLSGGCTWPGRAGWPPRCSRSTLPCCPWCSRCGRTASRTKATTAPWSWSPGSSASWPGALWSGWSKI